MDGPAHGKDKKSQLLCCRAARRAVRDAVRQARKHVMEKKDL